MLNKPSLDTMELLKKYYLEAPLNRLWQRGMEPKVLMDRGQWPKKIFDRGQVS
jgi:hypothetical protein